MNDLPNFSSKYKVIHNADDTNLLCRGSNVDNMIQDITNELRKIIFWFDANNLHQNAYKSTFVAFHTNHEQCTQNIHIVMDNTNVYQSSSTIFWGVIIDETITWLPHILFMSTKMTKTLVFFVVYPNTSPQKTIKYI